MRVRRMTRRELIVGGGAVLAPVLLTSDRFVEAQIGQLTASDRHVLAIPGTAPAFVDALEVLYPGLQDDPVFQKIAPLALLVKHEQGPAIRAFSVVWTIATQEGTYEVPRYFYVAVGPPARGHILSALISAQRSMLVAGQSRLVSPFFNWTPDSYQNNPTVDWQLVLSPTRADAFIVSELSSVSAVEVSLDGVVFSDWKMVGTDKHKLGWKIRARRNAEHDEGVIVYKLLKNGASDSEIIQALRAHGSAPRSIKPNLKGRWYEQSRRFHAQILLKAFQDADRSTFTRALARLKRRRNTVITNLNS